MIMNLKKILSIVWLSTLALLVQSADETCSDQTCEKPSIKKECNDAVQTCDADDGCATSAFDGSLEEMAKLQCEHKIPTFQCNACRYEIGVVKIPASLLKSSAAGREALVNTQRVARSTVDSSMEVMGEVRLNENATVHISPRIPGIIRSVNVDSGSRVNKGDVLFMIESIELGQAVSAYQRSWSLARLSKKNVEREKSLFEEKIIPEQKLIDTKMIYEKHKTELYASEQALKILGLSKNNLSDLRNGTNTLASRLVIRAPIDGTIIDRHATVGELAEPGNDVMVLADLHTVWCMVDIYEYNLAPLLEAYRRGPVLADVIVQSFRDRVFTGTIDYVAATMNEQTRTIKVRVNVRNDEGLLRPGMLCKADIHLNNKIQAIAIPKSALLTDEGNSFVFKHWKENYYLRRPVVKGREYNGGIEITKGLTAGEVIVTTGAFLLKSDVLREKIGAGCAH